MKTLQTIEPSEIAVIEAEELKNSWLLEINHHEARIFRSTKHGTVAQRIRPLQSDEAICHTDTFDSFSRGQEKPDPARFFGPVAEALNGAGKILVCGSGTGMANEMDQFVAWLHDHQPELAGRIVDTLIVDAHHLTDAQLLAKARTYIALHRTPLISIH